MTVLLFVSGLLWMLSLKKMASNETRLAGITDAIASVPAHVVDSGAGALSAKQCGSCHREHYEEWSRSFHARSLKSQGFLNTFAQYVQSLGQQARNDPQSSMACFSCHAPLLKHADRQLLRRVTDAVLLKANGKLDGFEVGCIACHAETRDLFSPSGGPSSVDSLHTFKLSQSDKQASFCGACHQWVPPSIPCSDVYSDWKKSRAAKQGATCQSCHMQQRSGITAGGQAPKKMHSHTFPGGRSPDMLRRALTLTLKAGFRQERLDVTAAVRNLTPHRVPDG